MGQKHSAIIKELCPLAVIDNVPAIYDYAFICNPTSEHIQTAIECVRDGLKVFMEKPIGITNDGLYELVNIAESTNQTVYVAYPMRHHPLIQEAVTLFKDNKPKLCEFVCLTNFYNWNQKRKQPDHVLLELSHEIDLAEHFMGEIKEFIPIDPVTPTKAMFKSVHYDGGHSWFSLDIQSEHEIRMMSLTGSGIDVCIDLNETRHVYWDAMYRNQLTHFFSMDWRGMNNIFDASKLFNKILELINANTDNNSVQKRQQATTTKKH